MHHGLAAETAPAPLRRSNVALVSRRHCTHSVQTGSVETHTCFSGKQRPVPPPGLVHIMGPTAELEILYNALSAIRIRDDVMKFQKPALRAAPLRSPERASPSIPLPDAATDASGDVTRSCVDRANHNRSIARSEFRLLELPNEQRQGAFDDRAKIAARDRMPQQILGTTEVVVALG